MSKRSTPKPSAATYGRTLDNPAKDRARRLMAVLAGANRILTGDTKVTCQLTEDLLSKYATPSRTNGRVVEFDQAEVYRHVTTDRGLATVHGLNYHELAHVLFTPRLADVAINGITQGEGLRWMAWNMMEDHRIEALLSSLYPRTANYLTIIAGQYFLDSAGSTNLMLHPLVCQRLHLPLKLRDMAYAGHVQARGQAEADEISKLISDYCLLHPEGRGSSSQQTYLNAVRPIIVRMAEIMAAMGISVPDIQSSCCDIRGINKGGDNTGTAESAIAVLAERQEEGEEGASSGDGDTGAGTGTVGTDPDTGEPVKNGPTVVLDAATDHGPTPHQSAGKGDGRFVHASIRDDVFDALADAVRDAMADQEVQEGIREARTAMGRLDRVEFDGTRVRTTKRDVTPEMQAARRAFEKELRELQEASDPGWLQYTSSGRLNVRRAMSGTGDYETMFDSWTPDRSDATSIEAVIAVDLSSSMHNQVATLAQSLWVIRASLASVGARVQVLGFNNGSRMIADVTDPVSRTKYEAFAAEGGTQPSASLSHANRVFSTSSRPQKVCVILTDGIWSQGGASVYTGSGSRTADNDELITRMNQAGVTTALAFLSPYDDLPDYMPMETHNCQIAQQIARPGDLTGMVKKIVKQMVQNQLGK